MANPSKSVKAAKAHSSQLATELKGKASAPVAAIAPSRFEKFINKLKRVKGFIVAIAGVGAVASGLVGYYTTYKTVAVGVTSAALAQPADAGPLSILVLPFANQSGDSQKNYVADAVTTSITSDLSRIRGAYVVPSVTAYTYKDKTATTAQLHKEFGIRFALQGSVLISGDRVRIRAQLADTLTGAQMWNDSFDGDLTDLFALQDQVTARIGNSIGREMIFTAARESEKRKNSPNVIDLILRASAANLQPQSLKLFQQTETWYREALRLDPENLRAILELSRSLSLQSLNFYSELSHEQVQAKFEESIKLAQYARSIDPSEPLIYSTLAFYAETHADHAGAVQAAQARLRLEPKNSSSFNNLGRELFLGGEANEAISVLKQGIALNPAHPIGFTLFHLGQCNFMLGNIDLAIDALLRADQINPGLPAVPAYLALVYATKGDQTQSHVWALKSRQLHPKFQIAAFMAPDVSSPPAYQKFWQDKFLPAARQAGLLDN